MSATPITDAAVVYHPDNNGDPQPFVDVVTAAKLETELAELQATLDLHHKANLRGIKLWQAAGEGRELTWPDQGALVAWLLEQRDETLASKETILERAERIRCELVESETKLQAAEANAERLADVLAKALPHIPGDALDAAAAMSKPIAECWINTIASTALAAHEARKTPTTTTP